MSEPTYKSILDLLIQHEEVIGDMYQACCLTFPDFSDFWRRFALEEKAHADVLRELERHLESEKVFLNPRKFNVAGIRTAIDHVNRQKQRIESGSCTLLQTMAIALDIERAIIDRDVFHVFETDSPSMKQEFDALRIHTEEHAERISIRLNQLREGSVVP